MQLVPGNMGGNRTNYEYLERTSEDGCMQNLTLVSQVVKKIGISSQYASI